LELGFADALDDSTKMHLSNFYIALHDVLM
jgi:hypothetical protein